MAGRSFRFSSVLAVIAATGFGCAEGASENANVPPLDGVDTGSLELDSSGAEGGADTGPKTDSTVTDTGPGDSSGGDGSGCDPSKGLTISCGVGECTVTMPACSETGAPNTCKPKDPGVEVCNGKDDDCDGVVDEDLGETECGKGECTVKQKNCVDGAPKTCMPKAPGVEVCDGKDNDCDGNIDNGFPTDTCGVGECKVTVSACSGGMTMACVPKMPGTEICNGKDDDCDGFVDEGVPDVTCGSGVCANAAPGCVGGTPGVCIPKDLGVESCGVGECVNFVSKCIGGVPQTCMPKASKAETCNGRDDNCDGIDDNGDPATMCPPPAGGSVTSTACVTAICKIASCAPGKADVDGTYANGCECTDKLAPSECSAPYDMGTVTVGAFQEYKTANMPVMGRSVWVKVTFLNARSNKLSNPRLELRMGAGYTGTLAEQPLVMDIITGGTCSGSAPLCGGSGEGSATGKIDFNFRYNSGLAGNYGDLAPPGGVKPFKPILPGSDENAAVFVRVYNKTGATLSCADFVLTARN